MPPKKRANGYKMPDPLPDGEILQDISKKMWKLGPSIGKGGFGEIYSAKEASDEKSKQYPYVVKIEPHANGPLFVEMNFLLRNAKKEDIETFMQEKKLDSLGMPVYIGSGSHECNNEKYRFVVLEKFGTDIWKLFLENKREFPAVTVFKIGAQILDALEYIHSRGYVHHDIKGANILLDLKNKNQVYLLDFGLASHYFTGKKFKPDPKKAHDGTLEYVSRDGHNGLHTRRGDLEILGYNLLQWLGCTLPWETSKTPPTVQKIKEEYMENIPDLIKVCFKDKNPPKAIMEYFIYLNTLNFDSEPDYKKLKKILINGIDSYGGSIKSPLVFKHSKTPTKRKAAAETPSSGSKPKLPRRKLIGSSKDKNKNQDNPSDNAENNENDNTNNTKTKKTKFHTVQGEEQVPEVQKKSRKGRTGTKAKIQEKEEVENLEEAENANGYTAEMKRINEKIAEKKSRGRKPKIEAVEDAGPSTSNEEVSTKRKRKPVNYTEEKIVN